VTNGREDRGPRLGNLVPTAFDAGGASFYETLRVAAPAALPGVLQGELPAELRAQITEGTTVLALTFTGGVVVAGDRRATAGNLISKNDMRKVFPADRYSAVAISGAAGPAMELAKVFATELEHYEKVEGEPLSLEGKANKLAMMVRANLPLAMQGLVVVPLFAGVDHRLAHGSIFEYDPIGGRYLARNHAATGSGSLIARGTLKQGHAPDLSEEDAVRLAIAALFEAADEDSATGGPDLIRQIYPIVAVIDTLRYRELSDEDVAGHVQGVVDARSAR